MGYFGKCKSCGNDATGNYYGGTDGLCSQCRSKEQEMKKQRQQKIKDEAISAIARKYGCSKEAAEVILKNGDR